MNQVFHGEQGYLDLTKYILNHGTNRNDRTNTGTKSIFHATLAFDLTQGFPALTTKKLFWNGVMGELLWFLSGRTDLESLRRFTYGKDNNQKTIWDIDYTRWHNTGRRDVPVNEGGRLYGKQWRDFSSAWDDGVGREVGTHVDQIKTLLNTAATNPTSRRLLVSAWNAADISEENMALPPCHVMHQLYIEDGKLNLKWSGRSSDFLLGAPFNIASYAMLTHIYAHWLNLTPGMLISDLTNVHIYNTHIEAIEEQLTRTPYPLCTAPAIPDNFTLDTIDQFTALDFPLINYQSHPAIKAPMAG